MGKIILSLAMSIDGFIASEDGTVQWLDEYLTPEEDYGMNDFFNQCGTAVMGSLTYEQTLSFNYWYGNMEGLVFTSRSLPSVPGKSIRFVSGSPVAEALALRKKEKDSWLVGGSVLIADFINNNLLDQITITVIPKLLGKGKPLCPALSNIRKLKLLSSQSYRDGVVKLDYVF